MCMGGGSDSAALARQQQQQQQAAVGQGQTYLSRVFGGGGPIGTGEVDPSAGYNPKGTYYDILGKAIAPTADLLASGGLYSGTGQTAGLSGLPGQLQKDYIAFATPQLTQQFQQTKRNLDTALADKGLTQSSTAQNQGSSLQQALALQQRGVADAGQQQGQALQSTISGQQNALTQQLIASSNPSTIAQGALTSASQFSSPSAFAPVGNFFSNWINMYGANQLAGSNSSTSNLNTNPFFNSLLNPQKGTYFAPAGSASGTIN